MLRNVQLKIILIFGIIGVVLISAIGVFYGVSLKQVGDLDGYSPIIDEQIIKPSTKYLIDGYKECLKILKHKDEIKQIKFDTKFEKVALQERLENMLKSKQLLKKKFKNGELSQGEYQQLVHNLNTEKFYLHQSIENCFKNIYEKKFGETIIKNLEEAVQILLSSSEGKDNASNA